MENENKPELPQEDNWLDEILSAPELGEELGVDEQAVNAAGLLHPADAQVEQIIQELKLEEIEAELEAEAAMLEAVEQPVEEILLPLEEADGEAVPEIAVEELQMEPTQVLPLEELEMEPTQVLQPEELAALNFGIQEDTQPEELSVEEPREYFQDEAFIEAFGDGEALNQMFQEELPEEPESLEMPALFDLPTEETDTEPQEEEEPVKKRRPRRKKGYGLLGIPHILATVIWLAIAVTIGVSLGRLIWVCAADVLAFGRQSMKVSVTITQEDIQDMDAVANKLKEAGLIKYPQLFGLYASITDAQEEIDPGTYELDTIYDYNALVNFMSNSTSFRDVVSVLIPEGYTCAQIFALLEEKGVCKAADLEEYAANGELGDYWFLEGVERGDKYCLEGYLFPDTYDFYVNDTPGRVLSKMLGDGVGGFNVRFNDVMRDKLEDLNIRLSAMMKKNGYDQAYIDAHQVTAREVVIVASMIEKETSGSKESFTIASVIYNRLTNQKEYPYLNIDATLIYALGEHTDKLTDEDKKVDSPYNTYTKKGLIPGPISNPGMSSLNAALDPDDTGYYFYVFDPSQGAHIFAETYKEHQANVDKVRD